MIRGAVRAVTLAAPFPLLLCFCGKAERPEQGRKDLGHQTADVVSDTEVMREASAAANEVVRNATDCDAAKTAIGEANSKLEEAASKVRTATGRATLDALRQRVKAVADACP